MATPAAAPKVKAPTGRKQVKAESKGVAKKTVKKYPENIRAATKRVPEITGLNHSPGCKQTVAVRKHLGDRDPIEASGMSRAALTRYAKGVDAYGRSAPETKALRDLYNEVGDPFAKSRAFAAILLAYDEERRAATKS